MDNKTLAGVALGVAGTVAALLIIDGTASAAPIDSAQTVRATAAFVTHIDIDAQGSEYFVNVFASAPRTSQLADGGTKMDVVQLPKAQCQAAGAIKTAIDNLFTGAALKCARVSADLE